MGQRDLRGQVCVEDASTLLGQCAPIAVRLIGAPRMEVTFSAAFLIPMSRQSSAPCLRWPCSVGIAAAVARPLGGILGRAQGPAAEAGRRTNSRAVLDKVPAVPFSGLFRALPSPEGKHSWHICHVQLNTASFRTEKKSNKRKSGSSTAPFSVLLHLSFLIPALNNTLYGEAWKATRG